MKQERTYFNNLVHAEGPMSGMSISIVVPIDQAAEEAFKKIGDRAKAFGTRCRMIMEFNACDDNPAIES